MKPLAAFLLAAVCAVAQPKPDAQALDPILKAMTDEMARSRALALVERPYFFEYQIEDMKSVAAVATMGALVNSTAHRFRVPQVQVRVGDYSFDNTNHVYSTAYSGARQDPSQWPVDNRYDVIRRFLWLATDRAYKTAVEGFSRKKGSLRNINQSADDKLPDFSKAEPSRVILPVVDLTVDREVLARRVVAASEVFRGFPEILDSNVEMAAGQATSYYVNSEGSMHRYPDGLYDTRIRAVAQAADGAMLRSNAVFVGIEPAALPSDAEVRAAALQVAADLRALIPAPVEESYAGPVLFEPRAAAQLFAQVVGDNMRSLRRPVSDPGRPFPFAPSDFDGKLGSRILPDWMDVIDDSTQAEWNGRKLAGFYRVDMEGVQPSVVTVVEKGVLKNLLSTRQPVRGSDKSNGHARLPGGFGVRSAAIGNLFVKAAQTASMSELEKQLSELCSKRGKPYGLLVRKLDYPSSMSVGELQAFAATMQGGGARPLSPPVLIYRVYADGRKELVRGLRFRNFNARALRDIVAASSEQELFNFVNNGFPFSLLGAGSYVAPTSVVAPGVLFEELELERAPEDRAKAPVVPAPSVE